MVVPHPDRPATPEIVNGGPWPRSEVRCKGVAKGNGNAGSFCSRSISHRLFSRSAANTWCRGGVFPGPLFVRIQPAFPAGNSPTAEASCQIRWCRPLRSPYVMRSLPKSGTSIGSRWGSNCRSCLAARLSRADWEGR